MMSVSAAQKQHTVCVAFLFPLYHVLLQDGCDVLGVVDFLGHLGIRGLQVGVLAEAQAYLRLGGL